MQIAANMRCSLCGEHREQVVTASEVVACDDCLALCLEILEDVVDPGTAGATTSRGEGEVVPDLACTLCEARGADRYFSGLGDVHVCDGCIRHAARLLGVTAADGPMGRTGREIDDLADEVSALVVKAPRPDPGSGDPQR